MMLDLLEGRWTPLKRCDRCGQYWKNQLHDQCVHCASLSDTELQELLVDLQSEARGTRRLGVLFAVLAVLVFVVMLVTRLRLSG